MPFLRITQNTLFRSMAGPHIDIPDGIENISDPDLDDDYIETNYN